MTITQALAEAAWRNSGEAMRLHLEPHSVTVLCFGAHGPEQTGSGTCIQLADRFFVATAAHIIDGYGCDRITLVHTRSPSNVRVRIIQLGRAGGWTPSDLFDLAWLEIEPSDARRMEKTFVPIDRLGFEIPREPFNVVVLGFPIGLMDPTLRSSPVLRVQPFSYSTVTMAADKFPPRRHVHTDMFFDMPLQSNVTNSGAPVNTLPDALGLSGAGMWNMDINRPGLWAPECASLIGIQRTASTTDEWLRGTPVAYWLRLVRRDHPDLAEVIDQRLPR